MENNRLIAEFLTEVDDYWQKDDNQGEGEQLYFQPHNTEFQQMYPSEMPFNRDWNWLMEVVKKIDGILYNYSVGYVEGDSELDDFYELELKGLRYHSNTVFVSCNIEEVYESVVEFIKWYKQIKTN